MTEKVYKALNDIEHTLLRPQQYVGSTRNTLIEDWVFDGIDMVLKSDVKYNEALLKIINEAIDNAIDNTNLKSNPTKTIKVTVHPDTITVTNDGASIPIKTMKVDDKIEFIPEVIFGKFKSGSNFNDERSGIGMNGIGIKACNILSKSFSIDCCDGEKRFKITWTNNMRNKSKPSIKNKPGKSCTTVTFKPDLEYFNRTIGNEFQLNSMEDISQLLHTRLIMVNSTIKNKVKIFFNGKLIKVNDMKSFMKLFCKDKIFYENQSENFQYGVMISKTDTFQHMSFVNTQRTTSNNSTHTKHVTSKVVSVVSEYLKRKIGTGKLSSTYISNFLHVFVNLHKQNPTFTSQTKTELSSVVKDKDFPIDTKKILGLLKKSGLIEKLENELKSKNINKVNKALNGKKTNNVNVPKLDDAHNAGTYKSTDATLFLVEGDSAKTMVSTGLSIIGRKKYGVFPLKGKVLNVINASPKKLAENTEIVNIMKIIGLRFGVDYSNESARKTLRYNKVCVLTDADVDGHHITGLLITFFNTFWPQLLNNGFLMRFITPIIKAVKGKHIKMFLTQKDYEKFALECGDIHKWHVQHLKGLGTSLRTDTLGYFKSINKHMKSFTPDEYTSVFIKHIFDPSESNWRKEWVVKPINDVEHIDYSAPDMKMTSFMKTEMHDYSTYNIKRAIPSAVDGLKVSQRKVLYHCLDKFKTNNAAPFKVAQLAGTAAAYSNYAHGEVSLQNTIINMAQSFSGSNNIPLLTEDGAFGSRSMNGDDAASPRYIFTRLQPEAREIFSETSPNVLNYMVEENKQVEPDFYIPELPMVLVNGSNGIATGFRTLIPAFNPEDLKNNIKSKFGLAKYKTLIPYYKGTYKTNHLTKDDGDNWLFKGRCKVISNGVVEIDEIPITMSIEYYKEKVLNKLVSTSIIKHYVIDHIDENTPKFILHGIDTNKSQSQLENILKLSSLMTKKCMNLLDRNGFIKSFKTIDEIFNYWFDIRMEFAQKSKQNRLKTMDVELFELENKAKFVKSIIENKLVIRGKDIECVKSQLAHLEIDQMFHDKFLALSLISCTKTRFEQLLKQYATLKRAREELEKKTLQEIVLSKLSNNNRKRSMKSDDQGNNILKKSKI